MFRPTLFVQAAFLIIVGIVTGWLVVQSYSAKLSPVATLARILGISVGILGAGMGAGAWFGSVYPPIFAITSIGMLTFSYLLYQCIRSAPDAPIQERDIRIAITGSITMMYLALVGFAVFMRIPSGQQEAPLAQSLVFSFTTLVGVVIAFYFGTSAYLESKKPGSGASQAPKSQQLEPPPKQTSDA